MRQNIKLNFSSSSQFLPALEKLCKIQGDALEFLGEANRTLSMNAKNLQADMASRSWHEFEFDANYVIFEAIFIFCSSRPKQFQLKKSLAQHQTRVHKIYSRNI